VTICESSAAQAGMSAHGLEVWMEEVATPRSGHIVVVAITENFIDRLCKEGSGCMFEMDTVSKYIGTEGNLHVVPVSLGSNFKEEWKEKSSTVKLLAEKNFIYPLLFEKDDNGQSMRVVVERVVGSIANAKTMGFVVEMPTY
jgi:hypothetical protein